MTDAEARGVEHVGVERLIEQPTPNMIGLGAIEADAVQPILFSAGIAVWKKNGLSDHRTNARAVSWRGILWVTERRFNRIVRFRRVPQIQMSCEPLLRAVGIKNINCFLAAILCFIN